jgi:hypothetical protein
MIRNIYIDGLDVRAQYGVWIVKGGYNDLFLFPALKTPDVNDWPEYNGLEVDLSDPKLEALSISLDFVASRSAADTLGFLQLLSSLGYHTFYFPSLGRSFKLRLSDSVDFTKFSILEAFRLQFIIDQPSREDMFVWMSPAVRIVPSAYSLDGVSFDHYGIFVARGRDNLLQPPSAKPQMTRSDISTIDGQIYDAEQVRFSGKSATLQCCLKAADMQRLWSCRDAFFAAWVTPGERLLTYNGKQYKCHYEQTSNAKLLRLGDKCMISFDLSIRIIDGQ